MQIRTVTAFADPGFPLSADAMRGVASLLDGARRGFERAGYTVQSTRFALPPLGIRLGRAARSAEEGRARVVALARDLERWCRDLGIGYGTIGPARPGDPNWCFEAVPEALAATECVFASAVVADREHGVDLRALRLAAGIIDGCARISPDGFGNLRFAALANVPPGVPFLPAAYHAGGAPAVAVGLEAASLAVDAAGAGTSPADARARLIASVESHAARLQAIVRAEVGDAFVGFDFSLAPFPERARSLGTALERLAGAPLGGPPTLAAVAFLADTIDRASFPRAGYSGVFLPVFEDAVLAARAAEGRLTLNDLLLYSAVCGTGLDTVPLPGDAGAEAIAAVLLDMAALALRLDKPLTARLMPIPGARAGDEVRFDFPYFAPTRVFAIEPPAGGSLLLDGPGRLDVEPRTAR